MTTIARMNPAKVAGILVLAAATGLAGCQTDPKIAAASLAGLGATIGCMASGNNTGGCIAAGTVVLIGTAIALDALERAEMERTVYYAARSGGSSSSKTFRNTQHKTVRIRATTVKTYKSSKDSGLLCRDVNFTKTVDGAAAGSSSASTCQVRVGNVPTWKAPAG